MRLQHLRRPHPLRTQGRRQVRRGSRRAALRMPLRPRCVLRVAGIPERLHQRGARQRGGRLFGGGEAQRQRRARRQPPHQRDIARPGCVVVPGHAAVGMEILPAVGRADIAGRAGGQRIRTVRRARRQRQAERPLLGPQHARAAIRRRPRAVAVAGPAEMRRQQHVGHEIGIAFERDVDQQHVARRVGADAQRQGEARMAMRHGGERNARRRRVERVAVQPLDLDPEARTVAHDEAEVADLRDVDARVVHLVDDAAPEGEPQPRRPHGRTDQILGTGRPGGRDAGGAEGRAVRGHGMNISGSHGHAASCTGSPFVPQAGAEPARLISGKPPAAPDLRPPRAGRRPAAVRHPVHAHPAARTIRPARPRRQARA